MLVKNFVDQHEGDLSQKSMSQRVNVVQWKHLQVILRTKLKVYMYAMVIWILERSSICSCAKFSMQQVLM